MITITTNMLLEEPRDELGKKIAELKREVISRLSRILVFEGSEVVDFNYCNLKVMLDIIELLEYYLLDAKEKNWLCAVHPHTHKRSPIKTLREFGKVLEDTKQMVLGKQPMHDARYNSMYFTVLYYLNRIQLKEGEDDGA